MKNLETVDLRGFVPCITTHETHVLFPFLSLFSALYSLSLHTCRTSVLNATQAYRIKKVKWNMMSTSTRSSSTHTDDFKWYQQAVNANESPAHSILSTMLLLKETFFYFSSSQIIFSIFYSFYSFRINFYSLFYLSFYYSYQPLF